MGWIEDHHAEWLSLVETSGPFLTVPALKKALPTGLGDVGAATADLRVAHAELAEDPELQHRFVQWVLEDLLGFGDAVRPAADVDPQHLVAEHGVRIRASFVVRDAAQEDRPVLLVHRHPLGTALGGALMDDGWSASPIDRAVELAKASEVPLALVTDGRRWTLVWARQGETTGLCTWRSELWLEEPITLRAFVELLGARRLFNLPLEEGLAELLRASAGKQQEVADQLGSQVRRATELLIATLDREDRDRHGELLRELQSAEVYRGATAVMMRLVFLFVAEERRLLPIDQGFYAETLAASTLRGQLHERADRDGEDVLERSTAAWHRILALFRAVHGGIEHDELRLPAYGGGLFDPDRHPFLEGRGPGSAWTTDGAAPLPVDDRTVLHILDQLQTLEQGGVRVQLSYQALDVEQIGHVYEGLLDHTAVRLTAAAVGLDGKLEPELTVDELERWSADDQLVERLAKATGKSAKAVGKALTAELDDERSGRLRGACETDDALVARVRPYAGLLRVDLRGDPLVFPAGSLFVTQAIDRRASGTYYTPRQLAEEVVLHALDPVAYGPGPAEEADPAKWQLKAPSELLELKVADIAMGSGAFLVAACRYLAARLQESWARLGDGEWTVFGRPRSTHPDEPAVPADPLVRDQLAHRLVTERCLYGVDKNPMAVEMAKLSLWLVTLAQGQPFSFVDHALRVGDSLLGVTSIAQLRVAHLDPRHPRQGSLELGFGEIEAAVDRALGLREKLEAFVVIDPGGAERKARMLDEAEAALADAKLLGDLIVGAALSQRPDADPLVATNVATNVRTMLDPAADADDRGVARTRLRDLADGWLIETRPAVDDVEEVVWADRDPFHWALEFPEVRKRGGFDAVVGNPPFQGDKKISGALGVRYRDFLAQRVSDGRRGEADLVAYFYLRAARLTAQPGGYGLIATSSVAQGSTRKVGLEALLERSSHFHRAVASRPWPGGASLQMATVWGWEADWGGITLLDDAVVSHISASLTAPTRVAGDPRRLASSSGSSFTGCSIVGSGFVLTHEDARDLVRREPSAADVVRPYLIGKDVNQRADSSPSRHVVDFHDWPEERARRYLLPFGLVEDRVKPQRATVNRAAQRERWWLFGEVRPGLRRAIATLHRCIAISQVSSVLQPSFVPTNVVLDQQLIVFAYEDDAHFGLLSSGFHHWWAAVNASRHDTRVRYTPTACFETFAQPDLNSEIGELGGGLHAHRTAMMLDRNEGLTKTYNRVHDPDDQADDVVRLREIHAELDHAVRDAYGWGDLELGHDFHETKFGSRYTFAPGPRQEVLDRLLELNHDRYADEVRRGLHAKKAPKKRASDQPAGGPTLFDE